MKVKFILIFGFLIVIISFLSVKYANYKQLKSDKMLKVYSSLDRIISEYFNKYWDIPDKENIRTFIENRKDAGEDKNIIDCLNYPGLKIIPDSSDNNVLIKLFSENNSIFSENAILLSNMNFFDFLLKREIFISQQPIDDLCSYFSFKFFSKGEPYENTMLKKKIHELLIKLFHDERKVDMKTADRCMFKCVVIDSENVSLSLVCGKIDDDFPSNELQSSLKKILMKDNLIKVVDRFYIPLYY